MRPLRRPASAFGSNPDYCALPCGVCKQSGPTSQRRVESVRGHDFSDFIAANCFSSQKEQFFAGRMAANASRPDHLPPSQGGKYVGFGSGGGAPPRPANNNASIDQVTTMLSSGWNQLSTVAGESPEIVDDKSVPATLITLKSTLLGFTRMLCPNGPRLHFHCIT